MRSIALAVVLTLAALPALAADPPGTFTYQQCAVVTRLKFEAEQLDTKMDQAVAHIAGSARNVPAAYYQQTGLKPADLASLNTRPRLGKLPAFILPITACAGRKDPILSNQACQSAIGSAQAATQRFNVLLPIVDRFASVTMQWAVRDPARLGALSQGFAFLRQNMQQAAQKVAEAGQISNAACSQRSNFSYEQQQQGGNGGGGQDDSRSRSRSPFRSPVNRN